jgi:hypothetical protein
MIKQTKQLQNFFDFGGSIDKFNQKLLSLVNEINGISNELKQAQELVQQYSDSFNEQMFGDFNDII